QAQGGAGRAAGRVRAPGGPAGVGESVPGQAAPGRGRGVDARVAARGCGKAGGAVSYVIGVDPGVSGAIVILQSAACPLPVEWLRMPTIKQGKSSRVDAAAVARFLQKFDCGHAYIEQVGSMPGQGVASTFTFGHAAGVVEGVVVGQMIPVT